MSEVKDSRDLAKEELQKLIVKEEALIKAESEALIETDSPVPFLGEKEEGGGEGGGNNGFVNNIEQVEPRLIEETMQTSYLNYAMSVIVSRALPDVRDGLKPVHRRILYAMHRLGLTPGAKYLKSANVVGGVMAKYHPHGDASIYDTMARFAQDFSMRYTLVDGQGNFGSIDGDSPAAMRYTEARMDKPTPFLLGDIDKDTVDFVDNYDGSTTEPSVLPAAIPHILMNGNTGIAVGMATEIPPHNATELNIAVQALIQNPEMTLEEVIDLIPGPDLPTAGILYGRESIRQAYRTGRGKVVCRSRAELEEDRIIITEVPYMVNKSTMLQKIAELVRDKRVEGIKEIRDESNKDGIRIIFETKRDASPEVVLNLLYKNSELESGVYFNLVALINRGRQPKLLNLREILVEFIAHRFEVVTRRTQFDLKKTQAELHILDGLKIALDFIDKVIQLIRGSYDKEEAATKLKAEFKLSDLQTEAILQMRLQTLTNLDKSKIEDERNAKLKLIAELTEILENPEVKKALVSSEINEATEKLHSPRRTEIVEHAVGDYNKEQFIQDEQVLLQLTSAQYIKYTQVDAFSKQGRGGRGKISFNPKDEDFVKQSIVCSTHDYVYAFTTFGRLFKTRVYDLPAGSRQGRGQNLVNYLNFQEGEKVARILTVSKDQEETLDGHLVFATKDGTVKRTLLNLYKNTRTSGIIAINLREGDELVDVGWSLNSDDKVVLSANNGKTVIFDVTQISEMGRSATGVRGLKLKKGDVLISLEISQFAFAEGGEEEGDGALIEDTKAVSTKQYPTLIVVTESGYSKQTFLGNYRKTNRAASGVKTMNVTKKTGRPVFIAILTGEEEDLLVTTKKGVTIRMEPHTISHLGRATQGIRAIKLDDGDTVASATIG
jgi:DNA gyrase subunit A